MRKRNLSTFVPHELRRTCAKLCHDRGGDFEQIQFFLGHASVQTTELISDCVSLRDGLGAWHFQFHRGIGDKRSRPEADAENAAESEI